MEIEFALPNELKTVEQYRQIIDAFIEKHLKDHYYAYAIHDKIGVMSNGQNRLQLFQISVATKCRGDVR